MDSILNSIKKLLGIHEEYTHFDSDLIIHINSVFMILNQIGIGPTNGYMITGPESKWSEFLGDDPRLESVKTYVHMRVKLLFDPPMSSAVVEAANRIISELEWRLILVSESKKEVADEL